MEQENTNELLAFFKALADENRLKIIGLLAQQPYTVEKLAETLGLGVSTTSHHLSKLANTGLVAARVNGHYYEYALQVEALQEKAQRLLHQEDLHLLSPETGDDSLERKVLANFIDKNGKITAFPAQEKKFIILLRHVSKSFEPGIRYPEKQVNDILSRYNDDTATLRRSLVAYKIMTREGGGGEYWINEE
jgi:predicted transcriptional regulator